jgi:2,3-dihydroxyphenylpropionate 1,2-dioxygenase
MITGAICMSHSPLIDRNRAAPDVERRFWEGVDHAAKLVAEMKPDLTIVFHPDHVNGFFYKLLPPFCLGVEATSIGDFGTVSGKMNVPEKAALSCAEHVLHDGVDLAISYRMEVDHGATQPLELVSTDYPLASMIPIFVNCAAPPRPTFARVRALGRAVGRWAAARPERILFLASGGLSHDPPIPALATATGEVRERLIEGGPMLHWQRMARQNRLYVEGARMAAGASDLLAVDPKWDNDLLDAFRAGNLSVLDDVSDDELTATGGRGGHEVRCWVAALAALPAGYRAETLAYEAVSEWVTGMGILAARPA